jgi:protein-tyrosine phosphatase
MAEKYSRHLRFESVSNFRDIGGYRTRQGYTIAWRRVFRSGEFAKITRNDFKRLMEEISPASVVDLRSKFEVERHGIGLLSEADIKYHNISFIADGGDRKADERRYKEFKNMGEFYLDLMPKKEYGQRIIEALEVIATPENHPLVFNCAVGKDRTGILAAVLLSVLGVTDEDIIEDYSLSGPYMEELLKTIDADPQIAEGVKALPDFFWKASPESMALFLNTLRRDYGSVNGYLEFMGSEPSLIERLEKALLS